MGSDNLTSADNQQERLDDYLCGYVDGEGSFHVAIQRNPSTRFKWQLVPEFHVSQNPERASVLLHPPETPRLRTHPKEWERRRARHIIGFRRS